MTENSGELTDRENRGASENLDVTVLAFAQWLSEMRARSNASLQQMLAEMGIIRNRGSHMSSHLLSDL